MELHDNRKHLFIKENLLITSETTCTICGFLLDVEAKGDGKLRWYDFIVECEHLLLRNIYEEEELKKMKIYNISDFYNIFERLINLSNDFELVLDNGLETSQFTDFFENELENFYSTVEELKEALDTIAVKKKHLLKLTLQIK